MHEFRTDQPNSDNENNHHQGVTLMVSDFKQLQKAAMKRIRKNGA